MNKAIKNNRSAGFTIAEALLIVVIIAAVVGVGAYVLHQKSKSTLSKTSTPAPSTATAPVANGTTASFSQLTQQDANTEAGVDNANDSQAQQASTSSNSAVSNVGGAYNENNL